MEKGEFLKNKVFSISLLVITLIIVWGILFKKNFETLANLAFAFLTGKFGWLYLGAMTFFVFFALFLAISKYGNIKLGPDDSKPDYSTASWFAMLFAAGKGIGLIFWGVAEPISHFTSPPGMQPGTTEAAGFAVSTTFMHWAFTPWANYSIIGMALAYFQFRKNKPGLISSIFIPLIGEERAKGFIGKFIDILAVFATVAGVSTSLGLGTMEITGGLNFLFNVPKSILVEVLIIAIVTVTYIWTAVTGIQKGIKLLSDIGLYAAIFLLVLVITVGPTVQIVESTVNGLGLYLSGFLRNSLHIEAFGDNSWLSSWTVFYWAWWIAWAPFVGTFIARISRGRTIREFIIGVTVAPAAASILWFGAFGTFGINIKDKISLEAMKNIASVPETALFEVAKHYPLGLVISIIAVFLLGVFFISSANSATFVLGMFTSNGDLNPSKTKKILWGLAQSLFAVILIVSGGLKSLQTISIVAAFPFIFIMIFACFSLLKALSSEKIVEIKSSEEINFNEETRFNEKIKFNEEVAVTQSHKIEAVDG
jgi:glycine betaine transporter